MIEKRNGQTMEKTVPQNIAEARDSDVVIMQQVRNICRRGNHAEIKLRKDGTLTVMEVKKNIVI